MERSSFIKILETLKTLFFLFNINPKLILILKFTEGFGK